MDPSNPDAPLIASDTSSSGGDSPRAEGSAAGGQGNVPAPLGPDQAGAYAPPGSTPITGDRVTAGGRTAQNPIDVPVTTGPGETRSAPRSDAASAQLNEMQKMLADMIKRSEAQDALLRELAVRQEQYDRRLSEVSDPIHSSRITAAARSQGPGGGPVIRLPPTRLHFTPPSQQRWQTPAGDRFPVFTPQGNTVERGLGSNNGVRASRHDGPTPLQPIAEVPLSAGAPQQQEPGSSRGPGVPSDTQVNRLAYPEGISEFRTSNPSFEHPRDEDQADLRRYLENQSEELRRMSSELHKAMSSAPEIDRLIEETRQTPFTSRIAYARVKSSRKYRFPQYDGKGDPRDFVKAFRLAVRTQVELTEEEEDPAYCRFFSENLTGIALEWFMGLDGDTIDSFEQLIKAFIRQFSVLVKETISEADFWKISQKSGEPLKTFVEEFKTIRTKISNINHKIAIDALRAGLAPHSLLGQELVVRPVYTIDDALHIASKFVIYEELESAKKSDPRFQKPDSQGSKGQGKKPAPRDNKTQGEHACAVNDTRQKQAQPKDAKPKQEVPAAETPSGSQNPKYKPYDPNKYCKHHERKGHSTEECAEVKKQLAAKFAAGS